MNKRPHLLARRHVWMLPVVVIVLLAGHGVILYYLSSHVMLSAAVLSGAIILLVIKHVGLLGPLYARFRRRRSGHRLG
jgi:membrane protein YdbS with pleckstrin-like domain